MIFLNSIIKPIWIVYNPVGNPLTWRDGLSFTWSNGRQLTGATKDGTALSFGYNSDGLRLHKTVGTSRTDYEWDGSALLAEQTGNNKILYLYDGTGLIGFKRNGVTYTYVYNGLGDVMEILDKDGNSVLVCHGLGVLLLFFRGQAATASGAV